MVISEDVIDSLKQIKLNLYERKLWVALLSRGIATAGELADIGKIPKSRCYDVLESLADKGFVIIQNTKPLKYVAVTPAEALERAKKKVVNDAETNIKRIENFKNSEAIRELEKLYKTGMEVTNPGELSGSLKGRHILNQQLETMFKSAKSKISILATPETVKDLALNHKLHLKRAAKKGVKIRIASKDIDAETLKTLKTFATVKKIGKSHPGGRFYIVDGKHVILPLTDEDVHPSQDTAFWAQSEHAAKVLEPMFEHIWEHMENA